MGAQSSVGPGPRRVTIKELDGSCGHYLLDGSEYQRRDCVDFQETFFYNVVDFVEIWIHALALNYITGTLVLRKGKS